MGRVLALLLACFAAMFLIVPFAAAAAIPDYIYIFDYHNPDIGAWKDKFEDDNTTNAKIYLEKYLDGKAAVIEGTSDKESFGCVYQDLTVNLDKYPTLEIDVNSVSKTWYIIIASENLEGKEKDFDGNQFVRIQFDINKTGIQTYNIKALTGLSGEQTFRLKLGVATGEVYIPIVGQKMLMRSLRLVGTK